MKLAKKMLAGVIVLAMVAALAVTVFAADDATISITAGDAVVGQNVTVTVSGSQIKDLCDGNLEFSYDPTSLELVGSPADAGINAIHEGGSVGSGAFTDAFMMSGSFAGDNGGICKVTFKVLKAGESVVAITSCNLDKADANGNAQPLKATLANGGKVTIKATEQPPVTTTTTEPTSEPTTVPGNKKPGKTPAKPSGGSSIPQTGEAGIAVLASVMAVAAVAFVATRKKEDK